MEPIAIIGIGCRFPGANHPEAFWQLLQGGIDAIVEVPHDRWHVDEFYDPEPATPGKMNTRYGGFIQQVDQFDPGFFGISPREAERMDPQQRLVLEVAWEALENAAIVPANLSGSQTGVFIGIGNYDFGILLSHQTLTDVSAYDGTGNSLGIAANRLSYLLNLRGPSLAIETACSSSLVATHLACRSLQTGESDLGIVGAVSLMLSPAQTITYSQARMMSTDGRCKTFDASADGYVRGEGCGIAILKRLSDAIRDGDPIQAVIRGSAINQDGLSNGLTAPNGPSQQAVIRQALQNAGVEPAQISYVEAHGTGTSLGDPIEVKSLKAVLSPGRSEEQPCWIGSVKTNIGHLEAAAGMAGLLKVVLSLQHQKIPPHLHLKQLNPYISLEGTPFAIPTELQPWNSSADCRFAGISSFGFGGTNSHLILEEAPVQPITSAPERPLHLLTLSAKTETALQEMAQQYAQFLTQHPENSLADVCSTTNTGRSQFEHRLAIIAKSTAQVCQQLREFAAQAVTSSLVSGQVQNSKRQKIAFLFTGQGSQYVGMGRELYDTQPVFRQTIDQCDHLLRPYLETSLLEVLYPTDATSTLIDQTVYTQPALFALEYALYQLWRSWGIEPSIVMGHSVGEYVAACVAGVFSLEDGLKLIAARGRLMQELPSGGGMVAVMADEAQVALAIQPFAAEVGIAAINGSRSIVISGHQSALTSICTKLEADGVKTKPLQVSHAFHSPLMEPMLAAFEQVASQTQYSLPAIGLISNVTGQLATTDVATPQYWCHHVRQTVKFAAGMVTLQQQRCPILIELGAKPILLGMGRTCLSDEAQQWAFLPSLRPGQSDWQQMLQSLAELFVRGVSIDWQGFSQGSSYRRVALPTYPFQRQRYWITPKALDKANGVVSDTRSSQIVALLNQGDTQQLAQQLIAHLSPDETQYLPKFLDVLIKQHHQQIKTAATQDWLYQLEWQLKPRDRQSTNSEESYGSWLILSDQGGVGVSLAEQIQQQGQPCILVQAGEAYHRGDRWTLKPSCPEQYQQMVGVLATIKQPLKGVIHLWSLDIPASETLTLAELQRAQTQGCGSVLYLMQALSQHNTAFQSAPPQVWLVTRGSVPVGSAIPAIAQAPLWGLGKVLALEHPEHWGGMIDLSPDSTVDEIPALLAEIKDSQGEDQLALRSGQRYVARLVPSQSESLQTVSIQPDRTYLITGGLGALGLKIAQWLVEQGARSLVLTGRRTATSEALATIAKLEQAGAAVQISQADVADAIEMRRVLDHIATSLPLLGGVVHAAGTVSYQMMQDMDLPAFESVLRPKVIGGWVLHQLTQSLKLNFFVSFSSIASVWGSKGQAHYAAANQFLDTLAYYRQAVGLPALTINWGPWAEIGMASGEAQQWLTRMGVQALQPDQALTALGSLLGGSRVQTTIADVDWKRFKSIYEARGYRPLLEHLEASLSSSSEQPGEKASQVLQQLASVPEHERLTHLITYLQTEVARVLGWAESQVPEPDRGFFDLGMDSLMAVELKTRLEKSFGKSLPTTLVFELPNIQTLAEHLGSEILAWDTADSPSSTDPQEEERSAAIASIEQLSEAEVEASIAERLAVLESLVRVNS